MLGSWLRAWVKNHILAGVEDAVAVLVGPDDGSEEVAGALARLRLRALPGVEANGNVEETGGKRRAAK